MSENNLRFVEDQSDKLHRCPEQMPPPAPELDVCIVVPMFAEYTNGYYWDMLDAFASQEDTPPQCYELLFAVNNGPQGTTSRAALEENRQTLLAGELINTYMRTGEVEVLSRIPDIDERKLEIVKKVAEVGLRFHLIDLATEGRNLAPDPTSTARSLAPQARNIVGNVAAERLLSTIIGGRGFIEFPDADCLPSPTYLAELRALTPRNLNAAVYKNLELIPEVDITKLLEQDMPDWEVVYVLTSYLLNSRHTFWKYYQPLEYNPKRISAPQLTVTAALFKDLLGYPNVKDADFHFGESVLSKVEPMIMRRTSVLLKNRRSAHGTSLEQFAELIPILFTSARNEDSYVEQLSIERDSMRSTLFSIMARYWLANRDGEFKELLAENRNSYQFTQVSFTWYVEQLKAKLKPAQAEMFDTLAGLYLADCMSASLHQVDEEELLANMVLNREMVTYGVEILREIKFKGRKQQYPSMIIKRVVAEYTQQIAHLDDMQIEQQREKFTKMEILEILKRPDVQEAIDSGQNVRQLFYFIMRHKPEIFFDIDKFLRCLDDNDLSFFNLVPEYITLSGVQDKPMSKSAISKIDAIISVPGRRSVQFGHRFLGALRGVFGKSVRSF